jgi:uncharacterized protein YndB with AHSA1/START domain
MKVMALAAENNDQDLTLEITRIFKAPRERVFEAWTTPEALSAWWGPKSMSLPEHEFNVREGGTWRATMRSPEGSDHFISGIFKEIIDQERLVFTWGWTIDGKRSHESTVTITFDDVKAGTKVRLHQALLTSTADREGHHQGWTSTFENLDDFLDGKPRATQ